VLGKLTVNSIAQSTALAHRELFSFFSLLFSLSFGRGACEPTNLLLIDGRSAEDLLQLTGQDQRKSEVS